MGIGIGIFLIVVGAILKFAVSDSVQGVDLGTIGWILMGAGLVALLLGLVLQLRPRRTQTTQVTTDPAGGHYVTERDDRIDGV